MDQKVSIKKQNKSIEIGNLEKCSKEELIERIKTLSAHNTQLKNIIAKTTDTKHVEHKNLKSFDFSKYMMQLIVIK